MKTTLYNFKRIMHYGKKYLKNMIFFIVGAFISIVINIIYPLIAAKQLIYITENSLYQLLIISIVILSIYCLNCIKNTLIKLNSNIFFKGVSKDIKVDLSKHTLNLTIKDIDSVSSGMLIQRLTSDTDNLSVAVTRVTGYITGIIEQIGSLIAVFILNFYAGIYYAITILILTIIYFRFSDKVSEKDKSKRKQDDVITNFTSELVRGIRDIKMLNAEKSFLKAMNENITSGNDKAYEQRKAETARDAFITIINGAFEFLLIILIIFLLIHGLIIPATALVVFNYNSKIYSNLSAQINNLISEVKNFNISASRVYPLLDNKDYEIETFGNKHIDKINGNFEFKNVSFGYEKKNILKDISFKIKADSTTAFVGKSGAGKTTIFNLLCKMYDNYKGTITIDGIDIKELDKDSIRGNISIISQSPYIFNMSIKDNLRLVKEDVTDKEIKEACKIAALDDYIKTLPDGYDTIIGEGGVNLSGGEKQRLAIARALVQKTEIILFDEATSALDNITQAKIEEAISNMKGEYTILIIAHRLSTVVNADKILFLNDGKIEATGTHKELLKKSKAYKELYQKELK